MSETVHQPNNHNIQIIHIHATNIDQYIDDVVPLFLQYQQFYKWEHTPDNAKQFLIRRLLGGSQIFLVYYQTPPIDDSPSKSIPIGFTQLYPTFSSVCLEENWLLNDLFINETYQGLKIGQQLLQHALNWGNDSGAYSMKIETTIINQRAQYLYPKMGFREVVRYDDTILYSYPYPRSINQPYKTYYE